MDKLRGSKIDGVEPTYETIASGKYPASRPLFIYVKKDHVDAVAETIHHEHRGHRRRVDDGLVGMVLEAHLPAAPPAAVGALGSVEDEQGAAAADLADQLAAL